MSTSVSEIQPSALNEPSLTILKLSIGNPTADKVTAILDAYRHDAAMSLYVVEDENVPVGVMGIERIGDRMAILRNIAVAECRQGKGYGRELIEYAIGPLGLRSLRAETHAGATDFYCRCGFSVKSLGEKYPGVERFDVSWPA